MIKIAPSILSADFGNLERDIRRVASADYLHVDVMDGAFVPNITIGMPVVAAIRRITDLPLDVHLMIDRPVRYVEEFCKAGADIVTWADHVTADIISAGLYEEFMFPIHQRAAARLRGTLFPISPHLTRRGGDDMVSAEKMRAHGSLLR